MVYDIKMVETVFIVIMYYSEMIYMYPSLWSPAQVGQQDLRKGGGDSRPQPPRRRALQGRPPPSNASETSNRDSPPHGEGAKDSTPKG